jgi:hypothetical protein
MAKINFQVRNQNIEADLTEVLKNDLKTFFEKKPLYSTQMVNFSRKIDDKSIVVIEIDFKENVKTILGDCPYCERERNFNQIDLKIINEGHQPTEFYFLSFKCVHCSKSFISYLIQLELKPQSGRIRKIGQFPAKSISVPVDLKQELGADAELYKRALMCISQSHGIGACAYLRRLIENQINPLLNLLYEIKEYENAEVEELEKIKETIKSKDFSRKTEILAEILPKSMIVAGINPLKLIHNFLSDGLHNLDEDRCTEIAQEISSAVEYVIRELNRQQKSKKAFAEKMKSLAKSKLRQS